MPLILIRQSWNDCWRMRPFKLFFAGAYVLLPLLFSLLYWWNKMCVRLSLYWAIWKRRAIFIMTWHKCWEQRKCCSSRLHSAVPSSTDKRMRLTRFCVQKYWAGCRKEKKACASLPIRMRWQRKWYPARNWAIRPWNWMWERSWTRPLSQTCCIATVSNMWIMCTSRDNMPFGVVSLTFFRLLRNILIVLTFSVTK